MVREREQQFPELKNSHHFVFDLPFVAEERPEFILISANPGDDTEDWKATNGARDEETRDRDFQAIFGRSNGSRRRLDKVQAFLGGLTFRKTTQTQAFFWCSKNTEKEFQNRFGYKYDDNPHRRFCAELNLKLIERLNPKAIFVEGHGNVSALSEITSCDHAEDYQHSESGYIFLKEWKLSDTYPLFSFTHLSALGSHLKERAELSRLLQTKIRSMDYKESPLATKTYESENLSPSTVVSNLGSVPYSLEALPDTIAKSNPALWVQGRGQPAQLEIIERFIQENGGSDGILFAHIKGKKPTNLSGLRAAHGSTRVKCLNACANAVSIAQAQLNARYGPAKDGSQQSGRPSIKSAWIAMLQGTYNPSKYPEATPVTILVAGEAAHDSQIQKLPKPIVNENKQNQRKREPKNQQVTKSDPPTTKEQALEAQIQAKDAEIKRLKSNLTLLEVQSRKRTEDADAGLKRERELAAKLEAELREQLAKTEAKAEKAEARAEAAEKEAREEAKKGVFSKLFS